MTVTIDGHATGQKPLQSTLSATLTTSKPGDAIIAFVASENFGGSVNGISSTNTTGWTKKYSFGYASNQVVLDVWYGFASAALSSEVITATLSVGYDTAELIVFGISSTNGPYASDPFDTNSTFPATASHVDFIGPNTTPTASGFYSDADHGLLLGFYGSSQGTGQTVGSGFTTVDSGYDPFGVHSIVGYVEYEAFSSQLNNASGTFGTAIDVWGVLFTAVVDSGAVSGTWASTERADIAAFSGITPDQGTFNTTETPDAFRAVGFQPDTGTWTSTEAVDTFAAAGYIPGGEQGSWFSTEAADKFLALGPGAKALTRRRIITVS